MVQNPIICRLQSGEEINIPIPLGEYAGSVAAATPLLRSLALQSYRPRDLLRVGKFHLFIATISVLICEFYSVAILPSRRSSGSTKGC